MNEEDIKQFKKELWFNKGFQKGKLEERERTKMILKEVKDTLLNWEDAQFSISVYRAIHIFIEQFIDVELKKIEEKI